MKTFQIQLTDSAVQALEKGAAAKGTTAEILLNQVFAGAAESLLTRWNIDLSIKQAAAEMGVHPETIRRYLRQKKFANAYQINSRVIRIPRADITSLKEDRRLSVA
jgi:hypothetical protein